MPVSAHKVANAFLDLAKNEGKPLTNMQLQKLVFLAQGYSLALLDAPLYYHNTHAWQWGPVIPNLYKKLQAYGSGEVTEPLPVPPEDAENLGPKELKIIQGVWNAYKKYSGAQLSELTHRPETPWSKTWGERQFGIIPTSEMKEYYSRLVSKTRG